MKRLYHARAAQFLFELIARPSFLFVQLLGKSVSHCCRQVSLCFHLHLLFFMTAVRFANVGTATYRFRYHCYLPFPLPLLPTVSVTAATYRFRYRCYLPFPLPLLPTVSVTAATHRFRYRCYLPFPLPLLPTVCAAAATYRLHYSRYLPSPLPLSPPPRACRSAFHPNNSKNEPRFYFQYKKAQQKSKKKEVRRKLTHFHWLVNQLNYFSINLTLASR